MNEIERAIKAMENIAEYWTCRPSERQAAQLAIAALREKQERQKGCEYCNDNFKFWQTQISGELPNVRFCPMCGKRLEVEHI